MVIPKSIKQFIIYFVVGLLATLVEWLLFYIFNHLFSWHYALSTSLAFAVSTIANWGFGRILLFKKGDAKGIMHEILSIYGISVAGLLANLLIMWICIEFLFIPDMIAKIIATLLVFLGNFSIRKFWLYKI